MVQYFYEDLSTPRQKIEVDSGLDVNEDQPTKSSESLHGNIFSNNFKKLFHTLRRFEYPPS